MRPLTEDQIQMVYENGMDMFYTELFLEDRSIADSTRFTLLGNVLRYLSEHKYNANVEDLKQLIL